MTREEGMAKLAELKSSVDEQVKVFNDAVQNGRFEESTKADKAMTDTINEYTATVRDMCFEECKATDDPMLAAVKTLSYVLRWYRRRPQLDARCPEDEFPADRTEGQRPGPRPGKGQ